MSESERVWLAHPDVGLPWACPAGAAQVWQARGYVVVDEPAPADTLHDPIPEATDEPDVPADNDTEPAQPAQAEGELSVG